jgi:glyoxylase-like metal-dependent hydrolase (beta-lactamase superfamily II)
MESSSAQIARIVSLPFEECTYVANLAGQNDCLVVDPGLEPELILAHLDRQGLTPAAILNTHGHADHIGGNEALKERWPNCPLVIGHGDAPMLTSAARNLSAGFGGQVLSPPADATVREGDVYSAAGFDLEVHEIPGHSPGHVVFIWKGHSPYYVFGGDVLFAGSIGRTDFPGGSLTLLRDGIHRWLFTLPDDTLVLPGHGDPTTIGEEKRSNPYVGGGIRLA